MKLRKINAVVSLITTALLLSHAISLAAWMLSRGSIPKVGSYAARMLASVTLLHAILSIILLASGHKGSKKIKGRVYPKMNLPTILQRVSGVLLLIFTWLHVAGTVGIMQPPQLVHAIVPPLFFLLALAHVAISVSKALITLGIGSAEFIKKADIAVKMLCVITWIADVVGFYLHVC